MNRKQSRVGEFARRGFNSPEAAARTWGRLELALSRTIPVPLDTFSVAANKDQALTSIARMWATAPATMDRVASEQGWLQRTLMLLGSSTELARYLTRYPREVGLLKESPIARSAEQWREFFEHRVGAADVIDGNPDELRRAWHAAVCQVAARDLAADDPTTIVHEISADLAGIARAVLNLALAHARSQVPGWERVRLAVVAMGKAGGDELNYVSDVDVIHIVEPVGSTPVSEAIAIGTRLAAALSRICSERTAEGSIWEVDASLRPEGRSGPLVRTLDSCRAYYQDWAENWEFQALLKAHPAAGDLQLGQGFCDMVTPMVWDAGQRDGFLQDVRGMRQRVIELIPPKQAAREIKLGAGGLRDTEFSVQLLQLVHGRADERIRARGTLAALGELVAAGYVGRADGKELEDAYRFQRVLEHRIQLLMLRRTHLVPRDAEVLAQVARGMHLDADELIARWRASTRAVQQLQQRIFFSPLLDAVSAIPTEGLRLTPEAANARLRALGFLDPRSALGHMQALTRGTTRAAEIQRQLMPAMLSWFADGPNPDFGLLAFRQLSEALGETSWYLRALRDEGWMAQRLATIASSSRYVVDLLKRAPEMVQMLASDEQLQPRSVSQLTESMAAAAARHDDRESAIASVRALRRSELCRIALSDVLGNIGLEASGGGLADLASASIDAALAIARRGTNAPPIGVIALGSWGGKALSYSSDVDLMYVVPDHCDAGALSAATEVVRRATHILGRPGVDPALSLDSDLRPEGKDGPQVRTVASYRSYYGQWASTWEAQALLRARAGAGELELADQVLEDISSLRYPEGGLTPEEVIKIRKLKSRMESERIPKGIPRERHLKLGQGGLSDIEWTAQLLQLQHAHEHPELRTTSTLEAIGALRGLELLTSRQADDLESAWRHIRQLRDVLMLARGRPSDSLPADSRDLATVAGMMGVPHAQTSELVEETRRVMRRATKVVDQVFWEV